MLAVAFGPPLIVMIEPPGRVVDGLPAWRVKRTTHVYQTLCRTSQPGAWVAGGATPTR